MGIVVCYEIPEGIRTLKVSEAQIGFKIYCQLAKHCAHSDQSYDKNTKTRPHILLVINRNKNSWNYVVCITKDGKQ